MHEYRTFSLLDISPSDIFPSDILPPGQFPSPPKIFPSDLKATICKLALTHIPDHNRPTTRSSDPNRPTRQRNFWNLTLTVLPALTELPLSILYTLFVDRFFMYIGGWWEKYHTPCKKGGELSRGGMSPTHTVTPQSSKLVPNASHSRSCYGVLSDGRIDWCNLTRTIDFLSLAGQLTRHAIACPSTSRRSIALSSGRVLFSASEGQRIGESARKQWASINVNASRWSETSLPSSGTVLYGVTLHAWVCRPSVPAAKTRLIRLNLPTLKYRHIRDSIRRNILRYTKYS